jgi:hypothetical protein
MATGHKPGTYRHLVLAPDIDHPNGAPDMQSASPCNAEHQIHRYFFEEPQKAGSAEIAHRIVDPSLSFRRT